MLISVVVHYCVPRLQNNCESVEMLPWYTIVSQDFGVSFFGFLFFKLFKLFSFLFNLIQVLKFNF